MQRATKIDVAIALTGFATSVTVLFLHGTGSDVHDGDALGVLLLAGVNAPLVLRRTRPYAALGASLAAAVGLHAFGYPGQLGLWPALAVYALAAHAPDERAARIGGLVAGASFAILGAVALVVDPDPGIAFGAVAWTGAWVLGDVTRQRRERIAALAERAQRAERDAARERRLAAAEERTRIARELHDSAGHAINVILVQAGAARLLRDSDPEASRRSLDTIEGVARATLGEIDRLVRVLRTDDTRGTDLMPLPGVREIETLVGHHRANGLEVGLSFEGERHRLPPAVERAAYRIVQEALTNAARHGDGRAEVVLRFGDDDLDIVVTNPVAVGSGRVVPERGRHGLVGMRERAALLGGRLEAGGEAGSFRIHAVLPSGSVDR